MMKKFVFLVVVILIIVGIYRFIRNPQTESNHTVEKKERVNITSNPVAKPHVKKRVSHEQQVLFVPYWNASVDEQTKNQYDTFVYFGIAVDEDAHIKEDEGLSNIEQFQKSTSGKKQLLTIRMLDSDTNHTILESTSLQKTLIDEILPVINQYDFDGIVLDLEVSSLPLTDVRNNISLFIQQLSESMHKQQKYVAITLYGDLYSRARPYDVHTIAESADEIMIMAYDFHKSRGEPGPNFPMAGRSTYGYDFPSMIRDFINDAPSEKVTVLFGMYGYDWALGPQGKPLTAAHALPLTDIINLIKPSCELKNCKVTQNSETHESTIRYTGDDGSKHEVWFEDEQSADVKKQYLEEQGIGSVGYWVYGYF